MAVKYKYVGELEVIIEDGDRYEITRLDDVEIFYYQPVGLANNPTTGESYYYTSSDNRYAESIVEDSSIVLEYDESSGNYMWGIEVARRFIAEKIPGINRRVFREESDGVFPHLLPLGIARDFNTKLPFVVDSTPPSEIEFVTASYFPDRNNYVWFGTFPSNQIEDWSFEEPFMWHQLRALIPQYKLDIFDDDVLIFSRTEESNPEYVEVLGKECPPDTCPVKCGLNVCCYGSDGISVENFLFSESIY